MSESILIWPSVEGAEALFATRQNGVIMTQRAPVDTILQDQNAVDTVVLPGQLVRALLTDIPERLKEAERLSVARFAHEDRLSGDPARFHVVLGSGASAPTRIIDPEVMDAVITRCDPNRIVADFDLLTDADGAVRVLDRVVVPGETGYAVDPDWAEPGYAVPSDEDLAQALFMALDKGSAINLRTGSFRRRRALEAGPWIRVAAVAVVSGLLALGVVGAEARAIQSQAASLEAEARVLYQTRTGQPAPARLSSLARQAAGGDVAQTQFLDLSQILFAGVSQTSGTQVERLSYEPAEGRLRLRLIYPNFEAAAALEEAVARAGGQLTTGGVREQNGVFIGDAALAEAGS